MIRNMEQNFREKHSQAIETMKSDLSPSNNQVDSRDVGRAELQAALSKIEQLKATITVLKTCHPNTSAFLKTYSSPSSLNPGIIGMVPQGSSLGHDKSLRSVTVMNSNSTSVNQTQFSSRVSRRGSKSALKEETAPPEHGQEQQAALTSGSSHSCAQNRIQMKTIVRPSLTNISPIIRRR